jgi:6-phosphogluconolactonase
MHLLHLLYLAPVATATRFFIGSYSGAILTANLDETTGALSLLSSTSTSSPSPSWQELSPVNSQILYTVEENAHDDLSQGAITSYLISSSGSLTKISSALGLAGPVSLAVSPDGKTIFTANYVTSGVSAYSTNPVTGALTHLQDWTFTLSSPGAVPERQEAPHPHQAIFDSYGKFVLVPDLGADLIRVFRVDAGQTFTQLPSIPVPAGTGPRHGAWYPATGKPKFFYLVGEIANSITVFTVRYEYGKIVLTPLQTSSTLPEPTTTTSAAPWSTPSAAEIAISPDGGYVYTSNRSDKVFDDAHSVAVFTRAKNTGKLVLLEWINSGEKNLRHITLDPSGNFLLVEGQDMAEIRVFRVDKATGKVEPQSVGTLQVARGPVCITWEKRPYGGEL